MSLTIARRPICLAALLLASLAFLAGCGPKRADAPRSNERIYRIAFASFGPDPAADSAIGGYIEGLKAEGFIEGKNLEVTKKHTSGDIAMLPMLMQTLDSEGYDLIVPMTTPGVSAACAKVKSTPMVFVYTYDPLAAGAGKSFTDHRPNMTGVASFPSMKDTMKVVREIAPAARTIGTIYNASEANSLRAVKEAKAILEPAGIKLECATISSTADLSMTTEALLARHVNAIWITGDNTVLQGLEGVLGPAGKASIPVVLNDPEFIDRGAVAAVGIGWPASGRAAGKIAARVLRGESPSCIPIVNLAEPRVLVNPKQAAKIGVTIPASIVPSK